MVCLPEFPSKRGGGSISGSCSNLKVSSGTLYNVWACISHAVCAIWSMKCPISISAMYLQAQDPHVTSHQACIRLRIEIGVQPDNVFDIRPSANVLRLKGICCLRYTNNRYTNDDLSGRRKTRVAVRIKGYEELYYSLIIWQLLQLVGGTFQIEQ